jgi:YbgC/YbaW family acyl-CoA thioester hydrolase
MFEYPVLIREQHLDTFGHMNNAAYLTLFEEARWELLVRQGLGMKDFLRLQQGPVILEVNLKFLKEMRLREQIMITFELLDYKGKVGHFRQTMVKADGSLGAEAVFTFGYFDLKARRLIEPTPEWTKALQAKT